MKEEDIYTWPNRAFPFKCLLNTRECRIFVIENIPHNYNWLKENKMQIRDTDFFFVILGWNLSEYLAKQSRWVLDSLKLKIDNFYILYNCPEEKSNGDLAGIKGSIINHNAWINESNFEIINCPKKYDALYVARPVEFKQHHLANKIKNLALAAGTVGSPDPKNPVISSMPRSENDPYELLSKQEICELINESKCGLCLSSEEGSCYSSSEYLLCGIPVVSIKCSGGREVWYNPDNSIACDPNPEAVYYAVQEACRRCWNAELIRSNHIDQAAEYRNLFVLELQRVLDRFKVEQISAAELFSTRFNWYCNEDPGYRPGTCANAEQIKDNFFRN